MAYYVHYLDADGHATITDEFDEEHEAVAFAELCINEQGWSVQESGKVNYIKVTKEQRNEIKEYLEE